MQCWTSHCNLKCGLYHSQRQIEDARVSASIKDQLQKEREQQQPQHQAHSDPQSNCSSRPPSSTRSRRSNTKQEGKNPESPRKKMKIALENLKNNPPKPATEKRRTKSDGNKGNENRKRDNSEEYLITGLRNVDGSTCYIGTATQGLANLESFTQELLQITADGKSKKELSCQLGKTIRQMKSGEYKDICPTTLVDTIGITSGKRFGNGKQQDAHELLMFMIEKISEETEEIPEPLSKPKSKRNPKITDMFYGTKEELIKCKHCGEETAKDVEFNTLYLDIPPKDGRITIEDCMRETDKEETVTIDCDYCLERKTAKRTIKITKYPKCLIVMLKRFKEEERKNRRFIDL